jgi:hypothetical protein
VARSTTFKYTVTVSNPGSGNKYYIDGNLQQYVVLFPGCTYEFNQDDSSNATHPLRFSETSDGTHNSGSEYTTGVTTSGTPGSATAFTKIEVTSSTPVILYYYCSSHSGMGGNVDIPGGSGSGHTDRGLSVGGTTPSGTNIIDYLQISTTGNASDFGDTTSNVYDGNCASNTTRCVYGNGDNAPGLSNVIQYTVFSTKGNMADFGDSTLARSQTTNGTMSNKVRGFYGPGYVTGSGAQNRIEVITIPSMGNAVDFGDRSIADGLRSAAGVCSPTRAVFCGGRGPSGNTDTMDYITMASAGNASDFGNLVADNRYCAGLSSETRGVVFGGSGVNVIQYITTASTGNATDFGDTSTNLQTSGGTSNNVRGVMLGGSTPSIVNTIQYITIGSTGNTTDFGDLSAARTNTSGSSGSHGGLQ